MGLNPGYAILEFYVSLVTYTVMHMIFVISSDFVEAFNIPPLNIGIYVDKLAAIRALLMVIADILEWAITQKALNDAGAYKKLSTPSERRIGSVFSFFLMWICRCHYIWILYFSNNKSLIAFINLCIEGFWFGVFQMSFFAVGPEYNAFTSLAIHTMGNFIFFTQVILNKLSKKYPYINCLYRVRVHAWVCLITSTISLGPWVYFCQEYTKGDTDQYQALICVLKKTQTSQTASAATSSQIATALAGKMKTADVTQLKSALDKLKQDDALRKKLSTDGGKTVKNVNEIAIQLGGKNGSENVAALLVKNEFGLENVTVEASDTNVIVKIGTGGDKKGSATVRVKKKEGISDSHDITISVQNNDGTISSAVGRRIARRLAKTLTQVDSVKSTETSGGSKDIPIKVSFNEKIETENVWSPFLLFIVGAFAEDFAVPGVLPFAFLDPEKANLINYLTPLFFFTGAFIILLLNDVFSGEQSVLMDVTNKSIKDLDSEFKEWSEGKAPGWHALWSLNLLKYTAFFISMWSIHGTYDSLRCIIQSRWRVLILTMFIVVPRATLEVAGYVGVANFAIAQGETGDYNGFSYIAYHDMLAMFCRFVYGKFAVGYNWTRVSLGYCLPKFRPRHKGFGFGFWWWVGRTLSRAWADTVKDFKADIKCYL